MQVLCGLGSRLEDANTQAPVGRLAVRSGLFGGSAVVPAVFAEAVNQIAGVRWAIDEVLAGEGIEGEFLVCGLEFGKGLGQLAVDTAIQFDHYG